MTNVENVPRFIVLGSKHCSWYHLEFELRNVVDIDVFKEFFKTTTLP